MKASIGIVDDHPAMMLGVGGILDAQDDLRLGAFAPTVPDLLAADCSLDLVLLDLSLGDGSTPAQNMQLLQGRGLPVLAYTSGDRPGLVREVARAGAAGLIRKSEVPTSLVRAVRAVLAGEVFASVDWAAALDEDLSFTDAELTEREREVLALYASGETADRVGAALFIARETVIDHVRRIRWKYAAVDRAAPTKVDLFRRAEEDGLLAP